MTNQASALQSPELSTPSVVYGEGLDPSVEIDPIQVAETMRELGVSEQGISDTTIYMDPKSRFQTYGTRYANALAKRRFPSIPEIQETAGDVVRLSTKIKGKDRPADRMNVTLVHELEHVAQSDRDDIKVIEGRIAIWGIAMVGAIIGGSLGKNKLSKVLGVPFGAAAGHVTGYLIAPHEREARKRAGQGRNRTAEVTTTAITRKR